VEGRVHDDVTRPRESPGVVALLVCLHRIGNDENIVDHEE
jgi:hypothetical protein